jgi:hypothetical protein
MNERQLRIAYFYGVCLVCVVALLGSVFFVGRATFDAANTWGSGENVQQLYEEALKSRDLAQQDFAAAYEKFGPEHPLTSATRLMAENQSETATMLLESWADALDKESEARQRWALSLVIPAVATAIWLLHWLRLRALLRGKPDEEVRDSPVATPN